MVVSNPGRIGHLAAEPDWLLKRLALEGQSAFRLIWLHASARRTANKALLDVWRQHVEIVTGGLRYYWLRIFRDYPELKINAGEGIVAISGPADYPKVLADWGNRSPLAKLTQSQIDIGQQTLSQLGVPAECWFVCLHAREPGYSPEDEFIHAHRNADISTYAAAAAEIAARGGWVVRVGDPTMKPLSSIKSDKENWPNTVDYACSDLRSEAADLFLCAKARFFLGTTSGLTMVASIFDVPSVLVNMIPHGAGLGQSPKDISIMKLLRRHDGNLVSFPEIYRSDISNHRAAALFEADNLQVVDNTPEEIRGVTVEMLDRVDGTLGPATAEDIHLQKKFKSLFGPEHYCYHSAGTVGRTFLRDRRELLELD